MISKQMEEHPRSFGVPKLLRLMVLAISIAAFLKAEPAEAQQRKAIQPNTRYLLFQIFTSYRKIGVGVFPPAGQIESTVQDITTRIGTTGDQKNKLGICLGPLTLGDSEEEVCKVIREGFDIAKKNDVAIAFHIDDQMFWENSKGNEDRKDSKALNSRDNIEWIDWNGTESTGRRLDWSEHPIKIAPPLCVNSGAVQVAVKARAQLIGHELKKQVANLRREGKEHLYAGIIAGWESMIGTDFATGKHTGYHALSNKGFSAANPPIRIDLELSQILKQFIELWAKQLVEAGAPPDKIFCHIAFTPQGLGRTDVKVTERMGFATPDIAFSKWYQPGFSLYPEGNTLEVIREHLQKHGAPYWAMSEGTNVVPNGMPGEPRMESYLAKLFNHGAVTANIYSWGIGGNAERERNIFRRATENPEALNAYRKLLKGETLTEAPKTKAAFSSELLREKIDRIQRQLPAWVNGKPERMQLAKSMMERLEGALKSNKFQQADTAADEALKLLTK